MKKFVLGIAFVLMLGGPVFAGQMRVENIVSSTEAISIPITTSATVYTKSFPIRSGEFFGLAYKCTSVAGTPNVSIVIEQSYELPTTEGSSDTEWVEPDNMSDVASGVTTETQHLISLSPMPAPYARLKLISQGAVGDTLFTGKLIVVEEN